MLLLFLCFPAKTRSRRLKGVSAAPVPQSHLITTFLYHAKSTLECKCVVISKQDAHGSEYLVTTINSRQSVVCVFNS
jgi:hypothetical protein